MWNIFSDCPASYSRKIMQCFRWPPQTLVPHAHAVARYTKWLSMSYVGHADKSDLQPSGRSFFENRPFKYSCFWSASELLTGFATLTHSPLRTCILYGTTWALTRSYMRHRLPKAGAYGVILRTATDSFLPQILGCRAVCLSVCQYIDELTCFEFAWLEIDPAILPQNLLMAAPSRRETCGSSPDRPCRNNLPMLLHGGYKSDVTALGSSTLWQLTAK